MYLNLCTLKDAPMDPYPSYSQLLTTIIIHVLYSHHGFNINQYHCHDKLIFQPFERRYTSIYTHIIGQHP